MALLLVVDVVAIRGWSWHPVLSLGRRVIEMRQDEYGAAVKKEKVEPEIDLEAAAGCGT
uniref:Uncharacterized protein n=1 Tax=Oryza rufipogon TaxID=4529 RepID=A0A0E0Q840_ORYRU